MSALFGTDGIRGVANQYPLDGETAMAVGRAVAVFFSTDRQPAKGFIVGQDTRISGDMVASALAAGICSMGRDVHLAGIVPTPGIAHLTASDGFEAGIVISASHNPFHDNGIKLFNSDGYKLSDATETAIEGLIVNPERLRQKSAPIQRLGRIHRVDDAGKRYLQFLAGCLPDGASLSGLKLVIDGSNGAASFLAPLLFEGLGAAVKIINCDPDGININAACGSQHPGALAKQVVVEKADAGLAFDGDADRLIVVDETGRVLTGDQVMAICAGHMKAHGTLTNSVLVTTVMSNMGLAVALRRMGIAHIAARVGDRHVMEEMIKVGAVLGGENSGHLIFLDHHTTGDGLLAAIKLIEIIQVSNEPLSKLATVMSVLPQCLINVAVGSKPELDGVEAVRQVIQEVTDRLGDGGRVLVRYSGTQPQCRIMVEGPTETAAQDSCRQIARVIERELS
jgi:phosphoglucosamine mutase